MEFKNGAKVITSTGDTVGHIDRVVLDPKTKEVTHLVVQKGFLFADDKIVPLSLIETADDEGVKLRRDAGDLDKLPPFEEVHYVSLDETEAEAARYPVGLASPLYWYPTNGGWMGYSSYAYAPPYLMETERNTPQGTVALEEGAPVYSSDDQHVGNVERVFTDSGSDRATQILISQGLLFKRHKLVPITWIQVIKDSEVRLSMRAKMLETLRDYEEA